MQNILLSGIGAVTTALVFVCRILWRRSEKCEADRTRLSDQYAEAMKELGELRGMLTVFQRCPLAECPHVVRQLTPKTIQP